MSRRLAVLFVAVAIFGLCAALDTKPKPPHLPTAAKTAKPDPATPIVAIRGQPLAEYEEPLPAGAKVRIGSTRFRHPRGYGQRSTGFAGRYLITTHDNIINLADTITGRRVWQERVVFGSHVPDYLHFSVSPDGGKLAAWHFCDRSTTQVLAKVWDVLPDPERPLRFACALMMPEGDSNFWLAQIVFPSASDQVLLLAHGIHTYDARSGQHLRHLPVKNSIIDIDEKGRRFLTSSRRNPLVGARAFDGMHVVPTYRFRAPKDSDTSKKIGRTKRHSLQSQDFESDPLTLMVVDATSGAGVINVTIPRDRGEFMQHLGLSPDGRYMSYETAEHIVVYDVDRRIETLAISKAGNDDRDESKSISGSWFSTDSRRFCVKDRADRESHYDLEGGWICPPQTDRLQRLGHFGSYTMGAVSKSGVIKPAGDRSLPPGYAGTVIDYLPDERLLAVGDATGRADVWNTDGKLVQSLRAGGNGIVAIAFSSDGRQLATCDKSRVVRVWRSASWRETQTFDVPADSDHLCPDRLSFSPDGSRLLVSQGDILALWDLNEKQWLWDRAGYGNRDGRSIPCFTLDGTMILAEMSFSYWVDGTTGRDVTGIPKDNLRAELQADFDIGGWTDGTSRVQSPTSSRFAFINGERTLQLWDIANDRRITEFPEFRKYAKGSALLRFSPDGRRLVTCDDRGHAQIWEVATGQLAFTLDYPDGDIANVFFTKDGRSLITSNHREVIVWDLSPEPGAEKNAWADLTQEAPKAEQARRALLANPTATIEMIRERLRPAVPLSPAEVRGWIQELDGKDFRARERAVARLYSCGRRVVPFLKEAKSNSDEARARLANLLHDLSAGLTIGERREVRCIEILEQIDTPAARELIGKLANGDPQAVLTEEAAKSAALRK